MYEIENACAVVIRYDFSSKNFICVVCSFVEGFNNVEQFYS